MYGLGNTYDVYTQDLYEIGNPCMKMHERYRICFMGGKYVLSSGVLIGLVCAVSLCVCIFK